MYLLIYKKKTICNMENTKKYTIHTKYSVI